MRYSASFNRVLACLAIVTAVERLSAEEHRFVLTSVSENVESDSFDLAEHASEAVSSLWQIKQQELHGGKQEEASLITIDNGTIIVSIVPTRGMSILSVRDSKSGDRLLGWDSPVTEIVHPRHIDLESRGGLGWLEGFNEWMVRCGLEFAGHPGEDQFINNTGDTATMNLTLHGKIGNVPASEVELLVEKSAPHRVTLRGVVEERMFYGPKLKLVTELSLLPNSKSIDLKDSVTNEGAADQEFQVIYHTNFGPPILEAGAKVIAPVSEISPMNDVAAKAISSYDTYAAPNVDFIEQVYLVKPHSDATGRTTVALVNASKTLGASVSWSTQSLPYLTIWKNTAALNDGYVTGIEPGTGYPFNRRVERHYGRVPTLGPGQTQTFELTFRWLDGPQEVSAAVAAVSKLATDRTLTVHSEPPENPFADE